MRITKVRLNSYVCFNNEPEFELGEGINFVVGKNNSGKTALIDSLRILNRRAPHRSVDTVPERGGDPEFPEDVEVEFLFSAGTLIDMLRPYASNLYLGNSQLGGVDEFHIADEVLSALSRESRIRFLINPYRLQLGDDLRQFNAMTSEERAFIKFEIREDDSWQDTHIVKSLDSTQSQRTIWEILLATFNYNVYRFEAQRPIEAHSSTRNELLLNFNASNLAQVMDTARRKRTRRYERMIELVKTVFPDICEIEIDKLPRSSPSDREYEYLEIVVGYVDERLERYDLRVPLSACGTGLGQVMAMLYVVVTSDDPRVIVIDEPQSFLHPDAIRKLVQIFQEYDHHQYIIATHSPTAIAAAREKTILHVERIDMRSRVRALNANDTKALGEAFRSLGLRPSDFLAVDAIIWVEGATEKRCFPLILETAGFQLEGVRFIPIAEIGDTTGKSAKKFIALLERVAKDFGLLPREVMCVNDGDKANDLVNADTERDVRVVSLPRQNFESYFLDFPEFLETVLTENAAEGSLIHEGKSVREWMIENNGGHELDNEAWLKTVDGASFIHNMFNSLGKIDYKRNKPVYGEEITRRILAQNPDHFKEIVDLIKGILEKE